MATMVTGHWPATLAMGEAMGLPMPMLLDGRIVWLSVADLARWVNNNLLQVASKDTWTRRNGMYLAAAYVGRGMEQIRIEWMSVR